MLNSKVDLFQAEWIDTIFEGRNKAYGAYDLRKKESRLTVRALVIGSIIFSLLVSAPLIVKKISSITGQRQTIDELISITEVDLLPPPEKQDQVATPPPPVKEIQSIKEIKKFTPPVVAPEEEVVEELVKQDDLKKADAGARNVDASEDGDIVIDERPVEHKVATVVTEDKNIYDVQSIQVMPSYPGGMKKFMEYIVWNLSGIQLEDVAELRMQFRFVIEKDGSLTDIQTISDGGYPQVAQRAIQVLGKSAKWSPGVINGKPVRVAYQVPIVVKLQN